ncbi:MAG: ABC transporter ATP-binding protein [Rhodospirillaceae bacterium]|nr:ABC transporter ATP-binding protein [Rhodospirillaceae bacterium]
MAEPLIDIRDLHVSFSIHGSEVPAVRGASFKIPIGGTVALVGESGSGKTVLSQTLMGILPNNAVIKHGAVLFRDPKLDGRVFDLAKESPDGKRMRAIRGGRISIIFQEPMTSLSPLHTIGSQIGEALSLHSKVTPKERDAAVLDMLRCVGFPEPARAVKTYPFELSGGLRQRAMIAMALVCQPALLVADEPTTALDVTIQAQILKLIRDLQRQFNMAVLMITHDLGVVANVAEEVVVMYHGEIMEIGTTEQIYRDPQHPYLKALMKAVPRFEMDRGERLTPLREIKAGASHLLQTRKEWPQGADILLKVKNLTKTFRTRKGDEADVVRAVNHVSFNVHQGECLGLVGESGCGKTTLSKIIMRALTPDAGAITYNHQGQALDVLGLRRDALKQYRQKVQFIFQDPFSSLNPRMTVFDIVSEPLKIHEIGNPAQRREMVSDLLQQVGLDPRFLNRYPHSFSGGQRQRIGIARALALRPDFLICDEPVSALDVSIQAQILNLLRDLQNDLGLTYLFISHNLAVVNYVADRIAVMCAGRIVEVATGEKLFRRPVHPYTKALVAAVPEPDLDHKLDFAALMEGKASQPEEWPEPFALRGPEQKEAFHDVGGGHLVRAWEDAQLDELVVLKR